MAGLGSATPVEVKAAATDVPPVEVTTSPVATQQWNARVDTLRAEEKVYELNLFRHGARTVAGWYQRVRDSDWQATVEALGLPEGTKAQKAYPCQEDKLNGIPEGTDLFKQVFQDDEPETAKQYLSWKTIFGTSGRNCRRTSRDDGTGQCEE